MKLKHYLSKKTFKRKSTKTSVCPQDAKLSDKFIEYKSEPRAAYTKDDSFLPSPIHQEEVQMRKKSHSNVRYRDCMMTQSLFTEIHTEYSSGESMKSLTSDVGCQTPCRYERPDSNLDNIACDTSFIVFGGSLSPDISVSESCTSVVGSAPLSTVPDNITSMYSSSTSCCCCYSDQHFKSLPSIQSSPTPIPLIPDKQYHSLPSSMMQSCYVSSCELLGNSEHHKTRGRSRIRTNPWLPPPTSTGSYERRNSTSVLRSRENYKEAPRLSRFFSEVGCVPTCSSTYIFYIHVL